MKKILIGAMCLLSLVACNKRNTHCSVPEPSDNKVLLLKVDYLTGVFEEGKELSFPQTTATTFTTTVIDTPATDFGSIKIMYDEVNQPIFYGTITWMGLGYRSIPQSLSPATSFTHVLTNDFVTPANGYDYLYANYMPAQNYDQAWANVQGLHVVRAYLTANPTQQVKVLLYTPSVGIGNPADWDWYFILKK